MQTKTTLLINILISIILKDKIYSFKYVYTYQNFVPLSSTNRLRILPSKLGILYTLTSQYDFEN